VPNIVIMSREEAVELYSRVVEELRARHAKLF
jgi:hypothetical protein